MRKQLIIKAPNEYSVEMINKWSQAINNIFLAGYPIVVPDDWTYEIVEVSEPMLVLKEDK